MNSFKVAFVLACLVLSFTTCSKDKTSNSCTTWGKSIVQGKTFLLSDYSVTLSSGIILPRSFVEQYVSAACMKITSTFTETTYSEKVPSDCNNTSLAGAISTGSYTLSSTDGKNYLTVTSSTEESKVEIASFGCDTYTALYSFDTGTQEYGTAIIKAVYVQQ